MKREILTATLLLTLTAGPSLAGWDEGVAAFTAGDWQGAAGEFREFAEQNPTRARAWYMYGTTALRLGREAEAHRAISKAYELNPNDLAIKISAELGAGLADQALDTAIQASRTNPHDWELSYMLGQALVAARQDHAKAAEAYRKAVEQASAAGVDWPVKMIREQLGFVNEKLKG